MSGEIKRALQLGQLATDMARLRRKAAPGTLRQELIERLGYLHGLPQKMAQLLATAELGASRGLEAATEGRDRLTAAEAGALIEAELGQPLSALFAAFDRVGISASLGQVHRARLHDGRPVAVKVQYPGIHDALSLDLKAINLLTLPVGGLKRGFDQKAYQRELQAMLLLELDYGHEAEMLAAFGQRLHDWPGIELPVVIPGHSRGTVLTMSWLEGEAFAVTQSWPEAARLAVAERLLQLFTVSVFDWGLLHGDPHPGNFRFRLEAGEPVLGLLDFGCVKRFPDLVRVALRKLCKALLAGRLDADTALALYGQLGFDEAMLQPLSHKLPAVSDVLFAPFLDPAPQRVRDWQLGARMSEVLGEDRWNFRFAGPANLIFFIRAYQGLIQYLKGLDVALNWRAELERVLDYVPDAPLVQAGALTANQIAEALSQGQGLAAFVTSSPASSPAQGPAPKPVPTEMPHPLAPPKLDGQGPARHVRIRLLRGSELRVALTFPIGVLPELPELIPEEFAAILTEKGVDVAAICQAAHLEPRPGILIQDTHDGQQLQVWLE